MDELELRIAESFDAFDEPANEVEILINGENLRDLVRRIEAPFAAEEGVPKLA